MVKDTIGERFMGAMWSRTPLVSDLLERGGQGHPWLVIYGSEVVKDTIGE